MAKSGGGDYFKRSSLFWIVFVTLGVGHFSWVVFAPGTFPFQYLGPYGTFCRYLVDNHSGLLYKGWWAALAIHAVEAFVSLKVCSNKGINKHDHTLPLVLPDLPVRLRLPGAPHQVQT
ncbi:hypothetical protein fugu_012786 [Takifugu bimaculatus]|uniref:Transmembrane protein 254 n=1 Tax=Takifugu bimaculatus TaxID=433685 RepID=A0A4Z2C6F3_9TELE|nr:hypothetical protein fugu_012786 [Takifugu bimaculatus]